METELGTKVKDLTKAASIDWTDLRDQLEKMTVEQIEMLELEDYWKFLESKTEGMSESATLNVYKEFGRVLCDVFQAKTLERSA